MDDSRNGNRLKATEKALEAADIAFDLASMAPPLLKSEAGQLVRSAGSVASNLEEGHGRNGGDRQYHWRIAYAEAREVDVHLAILRRHVDRRQVRRCSALFDEVRAMTWRLLHPRR